jgi:hypothetical protein
VGVAVEHQEWKIGWGWGFALPNRKSSTSRSVSVVCIGAGRVYVLRGKEDVVVTLVGCQDHKIGWGKGLVPPNRKPGAHALRAIDRKVQGRWPNVNTRVDVGIEVVGHHVGDNTQGGGGVMVEDVQDGSEC